MQPQGVVMVNGTNRQQPVPVAAGTGQAGGLQRKHRAHCVTGVAGGATIESTQNISPGAFSALPQSLLFSGPKTAST